MAKAGFWLRGARGKLAGASAQKGQNGTILREIVKPKNPKTDKQIYQRAIMATVMKAYSAGKEIFDHAFQGVEKGQKSQQYFIARNATLLRSLIADEINKIAAGSLQPTAAVICCVAPKALYAVPGAYMISEGTYEQTLFAVDAENPLEFPTAGFVQDNDGEDPTHLWQSTVANYAKVNGLVPGDIYTVIGFVARQDVVFNGVDQSGNLSSVGGTKQHACTFGWVRMQVKDSVLTDETVMSAESREESAGVVFDHVMEITGYSHPEIFRWTQDDVLAGYPDMISGGIDGEGTGAIGVIRSRLDEDLRSTSYMSVNNYEGLYGLTSPYILPTWKKGTDALGTSELILESDQ